MGLRGKQLNMASRLRKIAESAPVDVTYNRILKYLEDLASSGEFCVKLSTIRNLGTNGRIGLELSDDQLITLLRRDGFFIGGNTVIVSWDTPQS